MVSVSGRDADAEIVRAFELGINDYVTKPINLALVLTCIKAQLKELRRAQTDATSDAVTATFVNQTSFIRPSAAKLLVDRPALDLANAQPVSKQRPSLERVPQSATALTGADFTLPGSAKRLAKSRPKPSRQSPAKSKAKSPASRQESAATLPAKNYSVGHVLSQTPLSQFRLTESPHPTKGRGLCLIETFSPIGAGPELRSKARSAIAAERPHLEAIAQHKRIPKILSFLESDNSFSWTQTYLERHLLADKLTEGQRTATPQVLNDVQEILEALLPFHSRQIVHASVQPSHLWRTQSDSSLSLINLGLSQRLSSYLAQYAPPANRKMYYYEHSYMPIEQRIGKAVLSSDIYAVGLIALQLLTGETPLRLANLLLSRHSPFDLLPSVAPSIKETLMKMLSQEHPKRYQSASEALAALKAIAG